jgi:ArsR family transcriptional regulator, arsenate/arsenite/antimonite-responsive transcriptional repressor
MRLDDYFRGLSDLTRLRIINLLLRKELCGCDIQRLLGITQPLVSRHLVYLKRSGLVADRRDGFRVFYRLAEGNILRDLFACLQRAFRTQEPFSVDLVRLREAQQTGLPTREPRQRRSDMLLAPVESRLANRRARHKNRTGGALREE